MSPKHRPTALAIVLVILLVATIGVLHWLSITAAREDAARHRSVELVRTCNMRWSIWGVYRLPTGRLVLAPSPDRLDEGSVVAAGVSPDQVCPP